MQKITLQLAAHRQAIGQAHAGVVSSGDMEVLLKAVPGSTLEVNITTSVDNSHARWEALLARIGLAGGVPCGSMQINDAGATPGVARIRIEQVFEEVSHEQ